MCNIIKTILIFVTITNIYAKELIRSGEYIIDDTHKKMWQDNRETRELRMTHKEAVEYCQSLHFKGFSDWRLPSKDEVKLIVDKTRNSDIKINKVFRNVAKDSYWLNDRTWIRNFGQYGFYIFIKSGAIYYQNRAYLKYVRCVRDI